MPFQKCMSIKKLIGMLYILIGGGNLKKAQCIYCGKIVYVDQGVVSGRYEVYEENYSCSKKVSEFERCTGHRKSSGELGLHKYSII